LLAELDLERDEACAKAGVGPDVVGFVDGVDDVVELLGGAAGGLALDAIVVELACFAAGGEAARGAAGAQGGVWGGWTRGHWFSVLKMIG
jgi:hypothetical protein